MTIGRLKRGCAFGTSAGIVVVSTLIALMGCATVAAGCAPGSGEGGATPTSGAKGASSSASTPDAGKAGSGDAATADDRPFAGSTAEATSLISTAVDKKQLEISLCIRDFRARKKMARERVAVSFGIDQEGKLLGVTTKGKEDNELKTCVQDALKGAPFPRSHAGVITVTKTYEELVQ